MLPGFVHTFLRFIIILLCFFNEKCIITKSSYFEATNLKLGMKNRELLMKKMSWTWLGSHGGRGLYTMHILMHTFLEAILLILQKFLYILRL